MSGLNYKIILLVCFNILINIVLFYFAFYIIYEFIKSDKSPVEDIFDSLLHFIVGLVNIMVICPILLSSTGCGDPLTDDERCFMFLFCNICLVCRESSRSARKAQSKFFNIIANIIIDMIGLILHIIYFLELKWSNYIIALYSSCIVINIVFCIFRNKMSLFQDYEEIKGTINDLDQNKSLVDINEESNTNSQNISTQN